VHLCCNGEVQKSVPINQETGQPEPVNQALSEEEVKILHNDFPTFVLPFTCDQAVMTKIVDEWADEDDENPSYYDMLCAPNGVQVEEFNGCLIFRHAIIPSKDRDAIIARILSLKKQATAVAKAEAAAPAKDPKPKEFSEDAFPVKLYDLLAKDLTRIMSAKMRFAVETKAADVGTEVYTKFNIHDDNLYVDTFNQPLGVVLQKAYWYYSPSQEKENLISLRELKTRLDEATMALRRIPCELVVLNTKVSTFQEKLDASLCDEHRTHYAGKIAEVQILIGRLEAEERQRAADIVEYKQQLVQRNFASARPKPKAESPDFALICRAIRSLNSRNKKTDDFIAKFMKYAATFHKQTVEEKFNEDVAASGVSLHFRPTPVRSFVTPRVVELAPTATVPADDVSVVELAPTATVPAEVLAALPTAPRPRAPRPVQAQPERKGPSKSDRLAALMQKRK
jgi:hypothetical protein